MQRGTKRERHYDLNVVMDNADACLAEEESGSDETMLDVEAAVALLENADEKERLLKNGNAEEAWQLFLEEEQAKFWEVIKEEVRPPPPRGQGGRPTRIQQLSTLPSPIYPCID